MSVAGSGPALEQGSRLERRYRRMLALYPPRYGRVHEDEIIAVLLIAAPGDKAWPGLTEAADLAIGAGRVWCQTVARAGWRGVAALSIAGAVLGLLAGLLLEAGHPQLPASETTISVMGPGRPVRALAVLARSRQALAEAARLTRPVMPPASLAQQVQVSADPPGRFVLIRVQARTTAQAVSAVNALVDVLLFDKHLHDHMQPANYIAGGAWAVPGESARNLLLTSAFGALCGALLASILTGTLRRPGRRFRIT